MITVQELTIRGIRLMLLARLHAERRTVSAECVHDGFRYELWRCPKSDGHCDGFAYVFRRRPVPPTKG